MNSMFGFGDLTREAEAFLVRELELWRVHLPAELAEAVGRWRGAPVRIVTRAWAGPAIRYARFAVVRAESLEIGNLLCLPRPEYPLPMLGADLVAARREVAMLAADLSPTAPPGPAREAQLAGIATIRAAHPELPPGGDLPGWCLPWFSPHTLYTRVGVADLPAAASAFRDFPREFARLARGADADPARVQSSLAIQDGYLASHRDDDKGLGMLAKMFGADWADRYLREALFPTSLPATARS